MIFVNRNPFPSKDPFLRNLTRASKIKTVKKAPIGSINANAPLIEPIEVPRKNPARRIIKSKEYLLHGLTAQTSRRSVALPKLLLKLVG